jgi:hypothetical protein
MAKCPSNWSSKTTTVALVLITAAITFLLLTAAALSEQESSREVTKAESAMPDAATTASIVDPPKINPAPPFSGYRIRWFGNVTYGKVSIGKDGKPELQVALIPDRVLGLREDGVVVWLKVPPQARPEKEAIADE